MSLKGNSMTRTASASKISAGVPTKMNPDKNPKENKSLNEGAVADTFYGNSRMIDTDRVGD